MPAGRARKAGDFALHRHRVQPRIQHLRDGLAQLAHGPHIGLRQGGLQTTLRSSGKTGANAHCHGHTCRSSTESALPGRARRASAQMTIRRSNCLI